MRAAPRGRAKHAASAKQMLRKIWDSRRHLNSAVENIPSIPFDCRKRLVVDRKQRERERFGMNKRVGVDLPCRRRTGWRSNTADEYFMVSSRTRTVLIWLAWIFGPVLVILAAGIVLLSHETGQAEKKLGVLFRPGVTIQSLPQDVQRDIRVVSDEERSACARRRDKFGQIGIKEPGTIWLVYEKEMLSAYMSVSDTEDKTSGGQVIKKVLFIIPD